MKKALKDYTDALELYIPVLMAQAKPTGAHDPSMPPLRLGHLHLLHKHPPPLNYAPLVFYKVTDSVTSPHWEYYIIHIFHLSRFYRKRGDVMCCLFVAKIAPPSERGGTSSKRATIPLFLGRGAAGVTQV